MSEKYIIKNCPAYIHRPLNTHDRVCLLGDKVKPNHKELYVYCADCTDCLLKQIVKICNNPMELQTEVFPSDDYYRGEIDMSDVVLAKLNIQEVE